MTYAYYGGVTNAGLLVATFAITSSSQNNLEILFGSGGVGFSTIIEEVQGITNLTPDQVAHSSGTGSTYSTGTTSTTSRKVEYWSNVYAYYNFSSGFDPVGSSPSNGYSLYSTTPTKATDIGWDWTVGLHTITPVGPSAGILLGWKTVVATGTAGGTVADSGANNNTWYGTALAWLGPLNSPSVQINTGSPSGGMIRFPSLRTR